MIDLKEALSFIDPAALTYEEWLEIGMGLKSANLNGENVSWQDWDNWSRSDINRYTDGECQRKWSSFQSSGITKGTILKRAIDNGFDPMSFFDKPLDWNDEISYDGDYKVDSTNDFKLFINALFNPNDLVSYCLDSIENDNGKWQPASTGVLGIKASKILRDLEHYNNDLEQTLGDYNTQAGGWIRFNPFDGKGVKAQNVVDYRYVLVESDNESVSEQLKKIYNFRLPCKAIIYSGNKSIHALVHIDAKTEDEYRNRVGILFNFLKDQGFNVDTANKNPNRMCRLPGLKRGSEIQSLIDLNVGYKTWAEWKEYVDNGLEDIELPEIEHLSSVWNNMPELSPEIIKGVLREGHKMLIAAPSKAGKSFSLIELAIAIAEGKEWFGFECEKGKVLYLNLEIDGASFFHRIKEVYEATGFEPNNIENLDVWNLRGNALAMKKLAPKLINRARDGNYKAIILDPVYKVQSGDENAAGDISKFTNHFDKVCKELGTALIYCHHHSKGSQGAKRSLDRASGSGVFARDPDAIIDMIELSNETYRNNEEYKDLSAWRVEGTLREFPPFPPKNIFFNFPVHEVDYEGILDNAEIMDYSGLPQRRNTDTDEFEAIDIAFDLLSDDGNSCKESDMANYFHVKTETFRKKINRYNSTRGLTYLRKSGKLLKIDGN